MILSLDVGNTNISCGIFNMRLNLLHSFNLNTQRSRTAFEILAFIKTAFSHFKLELEQVKQVKIASVVPEINRELSLLFNDICKINTIFISSQNIPININIQNPSEVGVDRLVNVFSAFQNYNMHQNILIIDFGTAITFDIGIKNTTKHTPSYEGGIIFPGIHLSLEALKNGTSKLPQISLVKPNNIIGKNTSQAINSGIFYGYASMINGTVKHLNNQYSNLHIIITGGFGEVIKDYFNFNFILDESLTLKGIALI